MRINVKSIKSLLYLLILFMSAVEGSAYSNVNSINYCGNASMMASEVATDCKNALSNSTILYVKLNVSVTINGTFINTPTVGNTTFDLNGYTITGNGTGTALILDRMGPVITNGTIKNFSTGIRLGSAGSANKNATITNLTIINTNYGIYNYFDKSYIANNFINGGTGTAKIGIRTIDATGTVIKNNKIYNYSTCIFVDWNVTIQNNTMSSCSTRGIYAMNGTTVRYNTVSGALKAGGSDGIFFDGGNEDPSRIVADHNTVVNSSTGIDLNRVTNSKFYNNTFTRIAKGFELDGGTKYNFIYNNTINKAISGESSGFYFYLFHPEYGQSGFNRIYSNTVNNSRYGINVNTNSTNNIFKNNQITNSKIADIILNGNQITFRMV